MQFNEALIAFHKQYRDEMYRKIIASLEPSIGKWLSPDNGIYYKLYAIGFADDEYEDKVESERRREESTIPLTGEYARFKFIVIDGAATYKKFMSIDSPLLRSMFYVPAGESADWLEAELARRRKEGVYVDFKVMRGYFRLPEERRINILAAGFP
ncbi:MAG: hypothetical protein Q8O15_02780 [Rectinemataceae bacterium]|nr:hypothetical protein [Rectinemataceae bacterium]